jgi:D-tyrosyl-tRNA(Tyr) deacylase
MRAVWQKVENASVKVDHKITGEIGRGVLLFIGVEKGDTAKDIKYIVDKCVNLRLFEDENGRFNHSLLDTGGEVLLVSQFTLHGDCRRGRRPSFSSAARPETALKIYNDTVKALKETGVNVETGIFQADMKVSLTNDGPVTVMLDSRKTF